MYYKLIREKNTSPTRSKSSAIRGTLYSVEHRYSGSAGTYREYLTPICDTLENADYLIPVLVYKVSVTQSPKFRRLLPLLNQVPGRTGIRFHRGTKPEHSKGCILVSAADELVLTAKWLKEQHDHEEIRLEFC